MNVLSLNIHLENRSFLNRKLPIFSIFDFIVEIKDGKPFYEPSLAYNFTNTY